MIRAATLLLANHVAQLLLTFFVLLLNNNNLCDGFPSKVFGGNPFWYVLVKEGFRNNTDFNSNFEREITHNGTSRLFTYNATSRALGGTLFYVFPAEEEVATELRVRFQKFYDVFEQYADDLFLKKEEPELESFDETFRPVGASQIILSNHTKRDRGPGLIHQDASWELGTLSTPPGVPPGKYGYFSDRSSGSGVTIYSIDTGCYINHREFDHIRKKKLLQDWLWSGPFPATGEYNDLDRLSHGTGVMAKIAGESVGVVKNSKVVVVQYTDMTGDLTILNLVDALMLTYEHIVKNGKRQKVVVNLSWGIWDLKMNGKGATAAGKILGRFMLSTLKALHDLPNVVLVCGAGNDNAEERVKAYPALWAQELPRMVLVGGVDANGVRIYSYSRYVAVFAPAIDLTVPLAFNSHVYGLQRGTSGATAMVSGMLAYYMGKGMSPEKARKELVRLSYSRGRNGPSVPWNGEIASIFECPTQRHLSSTAVSTQSQAEFVSCRLKTQYSSIYALTQTQDLSSISSSTIRLTSTASSSGTHHSISHSKSKTRPTSVSEATTRSITTTKLTNSRKDTTTMQSPKTSSSTQSRNTTDINSFSVMKPWNTTSLESGFFVTTMKDKTITTQLQSSRRIGSGSTVIMSNGTLTVADKTTIVEGVVTISRNGTTVTRGIVTLTRNATTLFKDGITVTKQRTTVLESAVTVTKNATMTTKKAGTLTREVETVTLEPSTVLQKVTQPVTITRAGEVFTSKQVVETAITTILPPVKVDIEAPDGISSPSEDLPDTPAGVGPVPLAQFHGKFWDGASHIYGGYRINNLAPGMVMFYAKGLPGIENIRPGKTSSPAPEDPWAQYLRGVEVANKDQVTLDVNHLPQEQEYLRNVLQSNRESTREERLYGELKSFKYDSVLTQSWFNGGGMGTQEEGPACYSCGMSQLAGLKISEYKEKYEYPGGTAWAERKQSILPDGGSEYSRKALDAAVDYIKDNGGDTLQVLQDNRGGETGGSGGGDRPGSVPDVSIGGNLGFGGRLPTEGGIGLGGVDIGGSTGGISGAAGGIPNVLSGVPGFGLSGSSVVGAAGAAGALGGAAGGVAGGLAGGAVAASGPLGALGGGIVGAATSAATGAAGGVVGGALNTVGNVVGGAISSFFKSPPSSGPSSSSGGSPRGAEGPPSNNGPDKPPSDGPPKDSGDNKGSEPDKPNDPKQEDPKDEEPEEDEPEETNEPTTVSKTVSETVSVTETVTSTKTTSSEPSTTSTSFSSTSSDSESLSTTSTQSESFTTTSTESESVSTTSTETDSTSSSSTDSISSTSTSTSTSTKSRSTTSTSSKSLTSTETDSDSTSSTSTASSSESVSTVTVTTTDTQTTSKTTTESETTTKTTSVTTTSNSVSTKTETTTVSSSISTETSSSSSRSRRLNITLTVTEMDTTSDLRTRTATLIPHTSTQTLTILSSTQVSATTTNTWIPTTLTALQTVTTSRLKSQSVTATYILATETALQEVTSLRTVTAADTDTVVLVTKTNVETLTPDANGQLTDKDGSTVIVVTKTNYGSAPVSTDEYGNTIVIVTKTNYGSVPPVSTDEYGNTIVIVTTTRHFAATQAKCTAKTTVTSVATITMGETRDSLPLRFMSGENVDGCYGLKTGRYIRNDAIVNLVENHFCPKLHNATQESVSLLMHTYTGTLSEVLISAHWGGAKKPTNEECLQVLKGRLIEKCDTYDVKKGLVWKAGGQLTAQNVSWDIRPMAARPPAHNRVNVTCLLSSEKGTKDIKYSIGGYGFSDTDLGNSVWNRLNETCSDDIKAWYWRPVRENDQLEDVRMTGMEWLATYVGRGKSTNCVEKALSLAAELKQDLICSEAKPALTSSEWSTSGTEKTNNKKPKRSSTSELPNNDSNVHRRTVPKRQPWWDFMINLFALFKNLILRFL